MNEYETPTSRQDGWLAGMYRRPWVRVVTLVLAIPTLLALIFGIFLWQRFGSDRAIEYADIEEHFKYGSTGGEHVSGLPYWIFQALPQVCAKHLPGKGYESLGLIYEEGHDLPIGMSKRHHQGIDKTFLNCAVCHASTVRDAANSRNSCSIVPRTRSLPPSSSSRRRGAWLGPADRISTCSTDTSSIRSRWRSCARDY